ncbi:hypothetical protein HKX48_002095 [Thoreauomyces humboldtii]|nr:hypothetical protein HKX48_002095 [Thoreauomyces humboldtii]
MFGSGPFSGPALAVLALASALSFSTAAASSFGVSGMNNNGTCAIVCEHSSASTVYTTSRLPTTAISFSRTSKPGASDCCCKASGLNATAFLKAKSSAVAYSYLDISRGDRIFQSAEGNAIFHNVTAIDSTDAKLIPQCHFGGGIANSIEWVRPGATYPPIAKLPPNSIALIGDSITRYGELAYNHGWALGLRAAYKGRFDVVNERNPGWTTTDYLEELGPGWSVDTYHANLLQMVSTVKTVQPKASFLLITPPPPQPSAPAPPGKMNLYRDAMLEVGKATDTHVLDLWKAFMPPTGVYNATVMLPYLYDIVHFNKAGNEHFLTSLEAYMAKAWPAIAV